MSKRGAVQLWSELKAWYAQHLPEALNFLNPGASEEELTAVDEELRGIIGQGLPLALREIYKQNNGQMPKANCNVILGLEFLSLSELRDNWRVWYEIAKDSPDLADEPGKSYPPEAIRAEYINLYRVPFTVDGGGNHIGIDLQPGSKGQVGQIINYGADEERKYVIAPSLEAFLEWLLKQYQIGNIHIEKERDKGEIEYYFSMVNPPEHFLSAIPIVFGPPSGKKFWSKVKARFQ